MTRREAFWEHVNAALDERRDPLEDVLVQACVAEEPDLALELARLHARIEVLPIPPIRRRRRVAILAGAVLLATVAAYGIRGAMRERSVLDTSRTTTSSAGNDAVAVRSPEAPESAVIAFRSEVIVESAESRTITRFDGERSWRTHETHAPAPREGNTTMPALVARIDRISYPR
jgi:hypothetical protein